MSSTFCNRDYEFFITMESYMYKIMVITRSSGIAAVVHTIAIDFDTAEAALKAVDIITKRDNDRSNRDGWTVKQTAYALF